MLIHCVMLNLRDEADRAAVARAHDLLAGLVGRVPGLLWLHHGPNRDFEAKTPGFGYGFVCAFADRTAHLAYEAHPDHVAAGAALVAACEGGHAGIRVYDLEVPG